MTTFFLIRHGACDPVGKSLAGWMPGVHLNDTGRAQATRLAARLAHVPFDAICSSPLERARETAEPLADQRGLGVQVVEAFGEMRFGEWTGSTLSALAPQPLWRRFNTLRSIARAPGGETMLEVQARVLGELERLCELHADGVCAVFSHGDVIRATVAHYAGVPLDLFHRIEISPASVSVIRVREWGPEILHVNDTAELWPG